jgi:hypothetical protein
VAQLIELRQDHIICVTQCAQECVGLVIDQGLRLANTVDQYFTLPHLFRSDSGKSSRIPVDSSGMANVFQKVRRNSPEFRSQSGLSPVSV